MTRSNGPWRKLLWFVGLWAAGVATVTIVGLAIKLALGA
ncbi:hypothetical protein ACVJMZ_001626 [Sinorhizobium medicae]